jgi:hypothetical protein
MTERQRLEEYVADGFVPSMVVRKVSDKEKTKRGLPRQFADKQVYALPMAHPDGRKIMFYFVENDTLQCAEELASRQREVIAHHLCCFCTASSLDVPLRGLLAFDRIISTLREMKGWDARPSQHSHIFEVHFGVRSADEYQVQQVISEVSDVLLLLSLRNKAGFFVCGRSLHPIFSGQPLRITMGVEESLGVGLAPDDAAFLQALRDSDTARFMAETLQLLYTQVSVRAKLLVGWAAIEELFPTTPRNILSRSDILNVMKAAETVPGVAADGAKLAKLSEVLRDADRMATESRNLRVAKEISNSLGKPYEEVLERVQRLAKRRGRAAHLTSDPGPDGGEDVTFVEEVLLALLHRRVPGTCELGGDC